MEKPKEQETKVEMLPLNVNVVPESKYTDEIDGLEKAEEEAQKTTSPEVSFIQKMGKTMEHFIHLAKVGIFIVGGILFLLFLVWNVFASDEKTVREETMTKLVKVIQMQGGGSFSLIIEHPSNITAIEG